jgi:glycosyltransferase involved in cell wall biosynthesis
MQKIAIIVSHPIQYYAPVFKILSSHDIRIKVFYTWGANSIQKYDPDFQKHIEWDIPLLDGYDYEFLKNTSTNPGTAHFKGIINPDAIAAINNFNPDAILVYGWAWHSHLKIIRHYAKKKPVWFRGDSTLIDQPNGIKKVVRYLFLRWIYHHVDKAFYVGTHNKDYFRHFGLKNKQLKFAPHAIDNNRFSEKRSIEAEAIRAKFNIPYNGVVVLFAGKLEPKKDPLSLLQAFIDLSIENIYLLFAGNGVLEKELKEKASNSSKAQQVCFLDFQNQGSMPALYQACQLFCLPSVGPGETWGLAVNEAMAAGKAVLVSDKVGCSIDLVTENLNGSIFEAGNVKSLKEKLSELVKDRARLQVVGENSAKIIEKWSFEHQVSSILEEVRKL